jgi:hypothetical protein
LIELAEPGIPENLRAVRAILKGNGPGDAIVGVDAVDSEVVQQAVARPKLTLGCDGLALALFLCADAQVRGDGHGWDFLRRVRGLSLDPVPTTTFLTQRAGKCKFVTAILMTLSPRKQSGPAAWTPPPVGVASAVAREQRGVLPDRPFRVRILG